MEVKPAFQNALSPMEASLAGSVMVSNAVHAANILSGMLVNLAGRVTDDREEQLLKILVPSVGAFWSVP